MAVWDWFTEKFDADPAGWISLFVLVLSLTAASFFGKRIAKWARTLPARHRVRMERKYGGTPIDVVQSTIAVTFLNARGDPGSYTDSFGRRLGGTIDYRLRNLGPAEVKDLRVELDSVGLEPVTPMYWHTMRVGNLAMFTVHVPFDAARRVTLRWSQAGVPCHREVELPFGSPSLK